MNSNDAPRPGVHPTAIVEDGAVLGAGTFIWHHCHVRSTATIGGGCTFGKNVYVDSDVTIGDRVKIQNNVSVFHGVTLEDEVFVGPSAVFTNDMYPRAAADDWTVVPTLVRSGASIGANATLICGITIGRYATVAAGSMVTRDVEDHQLVRGNPAQPAGWMCACGRPASRDAVNKPDDLRCPQCREADSTS